MEPTNNNGKLGAANIAMHPMQVTIDPKK